MHRGRKSPGEIPGFDAPAADFSKKSEKFAATPFTNSRKSCIIMKSVLIPTLCGRSLMAELQLPKLVTRVRFPSSAPKREAKKDIEDKTSVFSRLPRPVDQQIYGPYFSDILPCAIHSGRSRTHTIFTLTGISFEAGILLLQDLGLFFCCRNRFPK